MIFVGDVCLSLEIIKSMKQCLIIVIGERAIWEQKKYKVDVHEMCTLLYELASADRYFSCI